MKALFGALFCFFIASKLSAQIQITGQVTNYKGKAIVGASVVVKDSYDGGITDSVGKFTFKTFEKGMQTITIKAIGYLINEQSVAIKQTACTLYVKLKEEVTELSAVTVTAGSFEASDKKRATVVLNSIDIVTTANANADITGAVKTLPGAQQIGEQEGLFVRGGTAAETRVFIDGTTVNNFFFTSVPDIAQRGRFSPFLFKGTVFSSGGYSALYGQALSGALILESIDLPERSEASFGISSVGVNIGLQELGKKKRSSWGIQYNHTNLQLYFMAVKQKPDYYKVPAFHNVEANARFKTRSGGMVKFYMYANSNQLGLRNPDIDSNVLKNAFDLTNLNWYSNVSWKENLSNNWKFNAGMSFSTNSDKIQNELQDKNNQQILLLENSPPYINKIFRVSVGAKLAQLKLVFEKKLGGLNVIRFGAENWYSNDKTIFNNRLVVDAKSYVQDWYKAMFAESDIHINNNIALKIGGRMEHSSYLNKLNAVPRLSIAYKLAKSIQVSAAYGVFYQKPNNAFLANVPNLTNSKATHYIANIQKSTLNQTFRTEFFYKSYQNLIKTFPDTNNNGHGFATGVEVFWRDKKSFKAFDYWISYSYLHTKRNHLNFPELLQPSFGATHTLHLVTKKFVMPWKTGFNATYTFASGRPYYHLINTDSKIIIADKGTTIPYHNISFSINYLPNLGKKMPKFFPIIVASITNAFNFKQEFGFNYSFNGSTKKAISPPAPQFFFLGCFLSIGVDRTQDIINNNL